MRLYGTSARSAAKLENGVSPTPVVTFGPTDDDVRQALADVASDESEFVILSRYDGNDADYIQAAGPSPFALELRIWLNDELFEHYRLVQNPSTEGFSSIKTVEKVMLHWLRTGRLPSHTIVKNVTDEFAN